MDAIIEVNNIVKTYKKRKEKEQIHAVNDISFHVKRGEILGLLGPNGAGKTTTIKMICGLLIPNEGSITINGKDTVAHRLETLRHISAVLEGNRNLYWRLTVRENLEYFAGNRGHSKKEVASDIDQLLEQFRLKDKEHELVNRLSRGMQQKLAIAVAMLADSEVILLDEPTLGLDIETGYEVRELLVQIAEEHNRTIIISTHDMDVVQSLCERVVIINKGGIVTDDHVENLMKVFELKSYKLTLSSELHPNQIGQIEQCFPNYTYTPDPFESTLEIDLEKSEQMYDLFDILKEEKTIVETIDRGSVNFEQIFLKIVKGEHLHELGSTS